MSICATLEIFSKSFTPDESQILVSASDSLGTLETLALKLSNETWRKGACHATAPAAQVHKKAERLPPD